jgi:hypothetical protein
MFLLPSKYSVNDLLRFPWQMGLQGRPSSNLGKWICTLHLGLFKSPFFLPML